MIENFEKLLFERKVDVLVDLHVFEHKGIEIKWKCKSDEHEHIGYWSVCRLDGVCSTEVLCYSTLLTSAWDIVRKFNHAELIKNIHNDEVLWQCKLGEVGVIQDYNMAKTEQLAICYAGLKAVGFDVKGFFKEEEGGGGMI